MWLAVEKGTSITNAVGFSNMQDDLDSVNAHASADYFLPEGCPRHEMGSLSSHCEIGTRSFWLGMLWMPREPDRKTQLVRYCGISDRWGTMTRS